MKLSELLKIWPKPEERRYLRNRQIFKDFSWLWALFWSPSAAVQNVGLHMVPHASLSIKINNVSEAKDQNKNWEELRELVRKIPIISLSVDFSRMWLHCLRDTTERVIQVVPQANWPWRVSCRNAYEFHGYGGVIEDIVLVTGSEVCVYHLKWSKNPQGLVELIEQNH